MCNINIPKVTVMIPTYNQEKYIAEAIESALGQDYPNLEIIVSDDCSVDNTKNIVKNYLPDKRIKYVQNEINLGRVGNYHNTLYHHATGEWVINLDGDDYYTNMSFISNGINDIIKASNYSKNIVACCFGNKNLHNIKKSHRHTPISENSVLFSGKTYFKNYPTIGGFSHMGVMYKREKAMGLDFYTKSYQASDFQSLIRLFLTADIVISNIKVGVWRLHQSNVTVNEVGEKQIQAMQTFDDIQSFAKDFFTDSDLKLWRKNMNKVSYRDYVFTYVKHRRGWKSFFLLLKIIRFDYNYFRIWFYFLFGY